VVGVAIGGGLAFAAKSKFNAAETETGSARSSDSSGAVSEANVATGVFVAGLAAVGLGTVLWLTGAPPSVGVVSGARGGELQWAF
jgi:hypothetical protein